MRRTLTSLLALSLLLMLQVPAWAANDTEVCHTHGGNNGKTKTLRVNANALPAFLANGGSEGPCDEPSEDPPTEDPPAEDPPAGDTGNTAPVAQASYTITIGLFSNVIVDGTASSDADGDALTYDWVVTDDTGTTSTYSGPTAAFGYGGRSFTVTLTVSDGLAEDSTTITIN